MKIQTEEDLRQLLETIEECDGSPEEMEAMWITEAHDRLAAFRRGEMETISSEDAFARIKKQMSK
jgi:hypothetical protein